MILTFDNVNFFFKFIRQFLASIDVVVFSLLSWMIEGVFNLSSLMLSADFAKLIYTRIYIILGVFMVFKLTFSFLKYLVSPDAMTDKEQGVGKLIGRVVAMIIMLIAFPIVFFNPVPGDSQNRTVLAVLQDGVVKTLPRIILGQAIDNTNASGGVNAKDNGKELALSMLKSFYYPSVCNEGSKNYDQSKASNCSEYFTGKSTTISDKGLESTGIDSFSKFYNSVLNEAGNDTYAYQYMWPLTTVTGILLIAIMAGICIDVAVRCFKLLILEVMAPVPIMTYIDPKASKDGSFAAWSKTLISTYIDLFVKLGTVYLVLLLASALFKQELFDKAAYNNFSGLSYLYVQVFLVIGLFQFAKMAPKFIKDALGIKDNGGGSGGFMGKALAGMAGAAAGFAGGVATGGLAGGLSGIMTGASSGLAGKPGQAFAQVRDEQAKLLGKTPGGIKGKLQNQAMQRSVMKHTGLSKDKLNELKKAKLTADDELAIAEADYANGKIDAAALKSAREKAGTANSAYESANSLAKQIGLKPGFMQENKRHGNAYIAATRLRKNIDATASTVKGKINDLPSTQWIKDKAADISNIPSNVRHSMDSAIYGEDGAADLPVERQVVKEDLNEYKESLRGGIGNKPDAEKQEFLRTRLKNDKKALRNDRKNFRNN